MGNKACFCCDEPVNVSAPQTQELMDVDVINRVEEEVEDPVLLQAVFHHLESFKPFHDQLDEDVMRKRFDNATFKGYFDQLGRPNGYGTMIYESGEVFVGEFSDGKANGKGHFVLKDGSYYHGQIVDNVAHSQNAIFQRQNFKYVGGVKENTFNGEGKEETPNYKFEGKYKEGRKVEGKLSWEQSQDDLQYIGQFNSQGSFEGKGKLTSKLGVYEGQFKKGLKDGKGEFTFKNGLKYVGDYANGIREGKGTIYAKNGTIAYSGEMRKGLPNGRGFTMNKEKETYSDWYEGINRVILPPEFMEGEGHN